MEVIKHEVQLRILQNLLFKSNARFSELNDTELTNDQFSFHLKRLSNLDLIKRVGNSYELTEKGLELAGRIDTSKLKFLPQPKVGISLFITRESKNGKEVLLEKRKLSPNNGSFGLHSSKIAFSESIEIAVRKCLFEETGLSGDIRYLGTIRIISKEDDIPYLDVLLNYFEITNTVGEVITETDRNTNHWIDIDNISNIENTFPSLEKDIELCNKGVPFFNERIETSEVDYTRVVKI